MSLKKISTVLNNPQVYKKKMLHELRLRLRTKFPFEKRPRKLAKHTTTIHKPISPSHLWAGGAAWRERLEGLGGVGGGGLKEV